MELLQLKYFRVAAYLQNFSNTAKHFMLPQSSISKTIAKLEQEVGCKLFERSGKHVYLNDFGRAFLKRVDLALESLDNATTELNEMSGHKYENVKLAVREGSKLLPAILSEFSKKNPGIRFSMVLHAEASTMADDFDLCISSLPICDERLAYTTLVTEEILLAVPSQHPLAQYSHVSLSDIRHESFISLPSSKSLRRKTDDYFNMFGYLPNIIFESDDAATVRGLIENGLGVAFIPEKTWKINPIDSIKLLHISDINCNRTLAICWYKTRILSSADRKFKHFIIEWCKRL